MNLKNRKTLIKAADKAASAYIIKRDGRCVVCGSTAHLTCGHLFSRVAFSTRWEEKNLYCQCAGCNLRHEYDPYALFEIATIRHGAEVIDDLHRRFRTPRKYNNADLAEIIDEYKRKLTALESGEV